MQESYEQKMSNSGEKSSYGEFHNLNYQGTEKYSKNIIPENRSFLNLLGKEILLVMNAVQLNILGQTFRPIFTGRVVKVTNGYIVLDPVIIKMTTAPFFTFPTPLSFPIENIVYFTPFKSETVFPIP